MSRLSIPVAARYGCGFLMLFLLVFWNLTTPQANFLRDLDGSSGLYLALAIGLLTPPRWLWLSFIVIAAYLTVLAGVWFYLYATDQSKNGVLLPVAFLAGSILLVACSVVSKRNAAKLRT